MSGSLPCGCDHDMKKPHYCERHRTERELIADLRLELATVLCRQYDGNAWWPAKEVHEALQRVEERHGIRHGIA